MKRFFLIFFLCVPLVMYGQSVQSDSLYSVAVDLKSAQKHLLSTQDTRNLNIGPDLYC